MMVNIFETDSAEATAYISVSAALYFILLGLLPAIFIFRLKINYGTSIIKNMLQRIAAVIVLGVVAVAIVLPNFQIYSFIGRNNKILLKEILPFSYMVASTKYINNTYFPEKIEYVSLGDDAKVVSSFDKPKLLFVVVGETARAENYGALGYARGYQCLYTAKRCNHLCRCKLLCYNHSQICTMHVF